MNEETRSAAARPQRNSTSFPLTITESLRSIGREERAVLQYHQRVVHEYFTRHMSSRGLLVFHGTGVGKTMLAVAIAETMRESMDVLVLSAKSLQHNFKKEIDKYNELLVSTPGAAAASAPEGRYIFISSNAGNMIKQVADAGKSQSQIALESTLAAFNNSARLDGKLLIVDEAQNLFNAIVNGSKNATELYRAIMSSPSVRLVFLSGTPIINDPFEMVPMFNMLHGSRLLPEDYEVFNRYFVDREKLLIRNREKLKNRIFGLVSYYGDWWVSGGISAPGAVVRRRDFPDQLPTIVERIPMSAAQFIAYSHARDVESKVTQTRTTTTQSLQKPKTDPGSTYRVASRQISNFLLPDAAHVKREGKYGFDKFIDKVTARHVGNLAVHSPKMARMLINIAKHPGLAVVYSSFVSGEGLRIFSMVLKHNGWHEWRAERTFGDGTRPKAAAAAPRRAAAQDTDSAPAAAAPGKAYAFISGDIPADERAAVLGVFNDKSNQFGADIALLMLSGAGAEGLDLRNVMSIHIMEPYWNYGRIEQIIARAIRYKSHTDYPEAARRVQPYIYLSDYPAGHVHPIKPPPKPRPGVPPKPPGPDLTTDVHLYTNAVRGKVLIDRCYAVMMEASIDCAIHRAAAAPEVRARIDCVSCVPTNKQLFYPMLETDMKMGNPCDRPEKEEIEVSEIDYGGVKYYYSIDPITRDIALYSHKPDLDAYMPIDRSHPAYDDIMAQLIARQRRAAPPA